MHANFWFTSIRAISEIVTVLTTMPAGIMHSFTIFRNMSKRLTLETPGDANKVLDVAGPPANKDATLRY